MTPIDPVFEQPELAELYDLFNPWMACDDFYKARAVASGGPVLDLGCGTGMLACAIAAEGIAVVGADPAEGMMRVARSRLGAEAVTWVRSAGQDLDLNHRFAFGYMTGHAFQAVLTDDDAVALLRAVARHLRPEGRFAFETRNPAMRAWERWTPDASTVVDSPAFGRISEVNAATVDPATGLILIDTRFRFLDTGDERVGDSKLRFIDRDHLTRLIEAAGLRAIEWLGDWDGHPFGPAHSPEIIAVVGRAG
ncbi:MAG: class I SAM-dependent methyltransferase [Alphaproteobacteria bacterium]|nr:class I SAM-dependent methyltransferase [Alphaproteobacteria bacterium]